MSDDDRDDAADPHEPERSNLDEAADSGESAEPVVTDPAVLDELSKAFDPTVDTPRPAPGARPRSSAEQSGAQAQAQDDTEPATSEEVPATSGSAPAEPERTESEPTESEPAGPEPGPDQEPSGETPLAPVLPIGEPRGLLSPGADPVEADRDGSDQTTLGETDDEETGAARTIKIGGDDDVPDAVYLDEELARDGSDEQTVFIDDDGSSDAIAAKDATGTGIEPRIRQRRIGVRRAEGLRRLRWVIVAAAVVLVVIGVVAFLASPVFDIDDVTVVGDQYTDPEELAAVVDDLMGTPVLLADTTAAEERLEAIPWVESARVRTDFPNAASIEIRERTPVAAMPGADSGTRVLDREGRILDVIEGQPIALVWIAGPITLDQPAGEFAPVGPSSAASLATKLTPTVRRRLDSMEVTPDGSDLVLRVRPLTEADGDGDGVRDDEDGSGEEAVDGTTTLPPVAPGSGGPLIEVRFGSAIGDNQQIEKLVRLERVLDDIGTDPVSVIDVSTAEVTIL